MDTRNSKILVFTVASWNSKVGSNTWASLLSNYDSKNIANVCLRDEIPDSDVCSRYFCISENRVLKSVLKRNIKTGREIQAKTEKMSDDLAEHNARYQQMQKKRSYILYLAREIIWMLGKWKTKEFNDFLDSFKPDIILFSMEGYIHLNRIVKYAIKYTGAKSVGYFWDDNFTYKQSSDIRHHFYRFFQRKSLKKLVKAANGFFAISDMTKKEADDFFGIDCTVLTKPLSAVPAVSYGDIGFPISMLYTGNLMIGRDKTLMRIVNALREINSDTVKFKVDVYTKTNLSDDIKKAAESDYFTVHDPIPQSEVLKKQREADILLFLEDIDGLYANTARLSFSTKTTDYLSSGKCIFASGCENTAPMRYFSENNAAITAFNDSQIKEKLEMIADDPQILIKFAEDACNLGIKNHNKEKILNTFDSVLKSALE